MMETCPLCGEQTLVHHQGEYSLYPPPNVPGGPLRVSGATWDECASCREEFLPASLTAALEALRNVRLVPAP